MMTIVRKVYWWWRARRAQQRDDALGYVPVRRIYFREHR
jgi:hypothetical protein